MRTLQVFFGVGTAVALLGVNVALADFEFRTLQEPVKFSPTFDTVDGTVTMPTFVFDGGNIGAEQAQDTCAMTPGGPSAGLMMDLPLLPPIVPTYTPAIPSAPFAANNALPTTTPYEERRTYSRGGGGGSRGGVGEDDPVIELVPEPTTLLIVGLGITGVAMARRRGRKA